ncbi:MAG: baeRF2 domain-containing protein [Nocardioidaceae bacterium]
MTVQFANLDRSTIRDLVRGTEPVASVYLGAAPEVANEYDLEWPTRWAPVLERMEALGVDPQTTTVLESAMRLVEGSRAARGSVAVAAFAAGGQMLGVFPAPGATWPDGVWFAAPAHVYPLLAWIQEHPPYVDVVVDRAGADLQAFPGGGAPASSTRVAGPDDAIEKPMPPGFLSQGRAQRRAEDSWVHNARAVAKRVQEAVDEVGARLIVVSGDVRAVQLLLESLPERVVREVEIRQVKGGRSADGSRQTRATVAAAAAGEAAAHQRERLLWVFDEERAPGGVAVEGEDLTLAALAEGRVGTLLVAHPVVDDPRPAWFGPGGAEVAPAARPVPVWEHPRRGPLLDVAVRSALLSSAEVRVVPTGDGAPLEGIGGLCRYR